MKSFEHTLSSVPIRLLCIACVTSSHFENTPIRIYITHVVLCSSQRCHCALSRSYWRTRHPHRREHDHQDRSVCRTIESTLFPLQTQGEELFNPRQDKMIDCMAVWNSWGWYCICFRSYVFNTFAWFCTLSPLLTSSMLPFPSATFFTRKAQWLRKCTSIWGTFRSSLHWNK